MPDSYMRKISLRTGLDILLLLSIFLLPWWFVVAATIIFSIVLIAPEVILAGLIMDALYGGSFFFDFALFFTVLFLSLFIAIQFFKRYIIVYNRV